MHRANVPLGWLARAAAVWALLGAALAERPLTAQGPASAAAAVVAAPVIQRQVAESAVLVGTLTPLRRSTVGSAVDGRVVEVPIIEGDWVAQGEPLCRLLTRTIEIELAAAEAELKLRQQEYQELKNGSRPEEIAQARARLEQTRATMIFTKDKLARTQRLYESRTSASREELDQALSQAQAAEQLFLAAQASYELAVNGPREERVLQAQARMEQAQQQRNLLVDRLEKFTIRAPFELRNVMPGSIAVAFQTSLFSRNLQGQRTIDLEIRGPQLTHLVQLGGQILGQVGQVLEPDVANPLARTTQARPVPSLDLSSPEVHVVPHPVQAAELGITAQELGYTVNALVDGAYVTDYYLDGTKIDLSLVGVPHLTSRTQDLARLPIAAPGGQLIPLGAVAQVELRSGPEQIQRRERQRAITIQVTPPPAMPLEEAIRRIERQIVQPLRNQGQLGAEYQITLGGTADKLRSTWQALRGNLLLALLITYLLMAALFESWSYPLVIILSAPLGAVGGILGLQLLNLYLRLLGDVPQSLDVLTMLGFVILIGTVVNNPILIVHQGLHHIRDEGMAPREAILESVRTRIRPIFMTTVTTLVGLLPLVLMPGAGSELYRRLGAVVLGGLAVSTFVTLVVTPALFLGMVDLQTRWTAWQTGRTGTPQRPDPLAQPAAPPRVPLSAG